MTGLFQSGKFLGVLFLFAGFLVSIDVFREFRIPFTIDRPRPDAARVPGRRAAGRGQRDTARARDGARSAG